VHIWELRPSRDSDAGGRGRAVLRYVGGEGGEREGEGEGERGLSLGRRPGARWRGR